MSYSSNDRNETTQWDAQRVRRAQEQQQQQQRRRPRKKRRTFGSVLLYLGFVLVISGILAGTAWLLIDDICSLSKEDVEVALVVTEEDSVATISKRLKEEGLINYRTAFRIFAGIFDAKEKIGPGVYTLNSDMDYRALINGMIPRKSASAETVMATIPEGSTVKEIIEILSEKGVNTEAALTAAAQTSDFGYNFIDESEKGDISRLEGYLFPDTYEFYVGEDPTSALKRLVDNFYSKVSTYLDQIDESKYSLKEIITIASLIEKETTGKDRETISSVIHNRLSKSGETYYLLQIDASLVYAAGRPITQADYKELDSPYNLYQHEGLPPTPISNPGLASIQAAVEPADTNYFFYVLGNDGAHIFSKTLAEHQKAIASVG